MAKRHGFFGTPTYKSWAEMKYRCMNPKRPLYKNISYCDGWKSFQNFLKDMGVRPDRTSLDRINNKGNYSKENCRWATSKQQSRNTRRNRIIEFNGKQLALVEWAEHLGIKRSTLAQRYYVYKWSLDRVLNGGGGRIG